MKLMSEEWDSKWLEDWTLVVRRKVSRMKKSWKQTKC